MTHPTACSIFEFRNRPLEESKLLSIVFTHKPTKLCYFTNVYCGFRFQLSTLLFQVEFGVQILSAIHRDK